MEDQLRELAQRLEDPGEQSVLHLAASQIEALRREVRQLNNAMRHLREARKKT